MSGTGAWLFGRELDLPETAVLVRVRGDRVLSSSGPVEHEDAFLAGLDVIECADLDGAIAAVGARQAPALLLGWLGRDCAAVTPSDGLSHAIEAWRRETDADNRYVMGSSFGGVESATALRLRDARTLAADAPWITIDHQRATVDVVACAHPGDAVALAATHPVALHAVIEVRRFLS